MRADDFFIYGENDDIFFSQMLKFFTNYFSFLEAILCDETKKKKVWKYKSVSGDFGIGISLLNWFQLQWKKLFLFYLLL